MNHFTNQEREKSSKRDNFSPSFSIVIGINQVKGSELTKIEN